MNLSDFHFREVGVVIFADESTLHDYSNIHHQFLVSRGVIPNDWAPQEFMISPSFSQVAYKNGVQLTISDEVLDISHSQDLQSGERYESADIALKYLASMKPITYDGLFMKWTVIAVCDDPGKWIREHFFRPGIVSSDWDDFLARPSISFVVDQLTIALNFAAIPLRPDAESDQNAVRVGCIIRHNDISKKDELIGRLSSWQDFEEIMLSNLKALMGVEQDDSTAWCPSTPRYRSRL